MMPFFLAIAVCLAPAQSPPHDDRGVIDLAHPPSRALDTRLVASSQIDPDDANADQHPAEHLRGPGIVIDLRAQCAEDRDYQLTYLDVRRWESQHGRIPNGAVLLVLTGWGDRWPDREAYLGLDDEGVPHHPGLSADVATYLTTYRDLSGVGIDTAGVDRGGGDDQAVRRIFSDGGVFLIENVARLEEVPPTGTTIVVAPREAASPEAAAWRVEAMVDPRSTPLPAIPGEKFLIEFGWDIPDERTLADAAVAGTPFDGAVFEPRIENPDGTTRSFTWMGFGAERIADGQVERVIDELDATPAAFRRRSFVRFNVTPGDVDWFDDFGAIMANARAAARMARDGGCAGILLDVEQYEGKIFDYRERPAGHSFKEYEAQVAERGREFILAINEVHPTIEILLTYGYSLADRRREQAAYGLFPAFLDGMLDGGAGDGRLIDGYEYAYPFKSRRAFERGREEVLRDGGGRLSVSFGIWMDWNSGRYGWHPEETSRNWFGPEDFSAAVHYALELSDKYVWIYTERLNWWTREDVPDAYMEALRDAARR